MHEIIGASDSSKFYTPKAITDANWFGQKTRETSVAQQGYHVGYYIYTVDGPRVTVTTTPTTRATGSRTRATRPGHRAGTHITPNFHFVKMGTWGYSQNGKEFVVGGGTGNGTSNSPSYTVVKDSFSGTNARILAGAYANSATDLSGRTLAQAIDTGWKSAAERDGLSSNILTLWGLTSFGTPD